MFPLGRCGFGCAALFCCFLPCFSIYCFYKPTERGSTVIDTERFLQARKEALGRVGGAGGIGTLSEKALHAALKSYYEPDFESREVKVGGFVADIVGENGIIEIQTRGFDRLGRKLDAFLEAARVTVVYPVVPKRGLCWVDPETGEIFEKRKSPKKGAAYDVFPELYKIKNQFMHPNFRLCIPLLEVTDYKHLDGYGKQKKLRATRGERIPEALLGEVICESRWDYLNLLPEDLPEPFTTKTLAKAMRRSQTQAQCAANCCIPWVFWSVWVRRKTHICT